jgi:hypothetical protein
MKKAVTTPSPMMKEEKSKSMIEPPREEAPREGTPREEAVVEEVAAGVEPVAS